MIELTVQFQLVISSVIFSMIATNLYTLIDIMLRKSKVFRSVIELCFFIIVSTTYYYLVYKINKGIFSVYLPICLIVGYYLHMRFYDKHFSCLYKYLFSKIHSIIDKRRGKWQRLWKEVIKKKIEKAKSTESSHIS